MDFNLITKGYSFEVIKEKAIDAGYSIEKGFSRRNDGSLIVDNDGKRKSGYMLYDNVRNEYVRTFNRGYYRFIAGMYTLTLTEVENYIEGVYEDAELEY
jgi:hypothetical protein